MTPRLLVRCDLAGIVYKVVLGVVDGDVIGVVMGSTFLEQVNYSVESNSLYYRLLSHANKVLCISVFGVLITLLISYPYAGYFSIPVPIFAHISTIVLAAIVKVSYVLRCVAQHGLGQEVR